MAGVEFQIPARHIQLRGKRLPDLARMAAGIHVGRQVAAPLHTSRHAILAAKTTRRWRTGRGVSRPLFQRREQATIPVAIGQDVRDWWASRSEPVRRGQLAWVGYNPATRPKNIYLRLYLCTWENPRPEKTIASIDYVAVHPLPVLSAWPSLPKSHVPDKTSPCSETKPEDALESLARVTSLRRTAACRCTTPIAQGERIRGTRSLVKQKYCPFFCNKCFSS